MCCALRASKRPRSSPSARRRRKSPTGSSICLDEFPQTRLLFAPMTACICSHCRIADRLRRARDVRGGLKFGAKTLEGLGSIETTAQETRGRELAKRDFCVWRCRRRKASLRPRHGLHATVSPEPLVKPRKREESGVIRLSAEGDLGVDQAFHSSLTPLAASSTSPARMKSRTRKRLTSGGAECPADCCASWWRSATASSIAMRRRGYRCGWGW